jgi:(4S)-4-hydroxy-5-phosphonooxypentane-2,3-dione isomerase
MIIRIVKLTIQPEKMDEFIAHFQANKKKIRSVAGCRTLALFRDSSDPCIFFTYSHWKTPEHLEDYRQSELFKGIWSAVKPMFMLAPEAWSLDEVVRYM